MDHLFKVYESLDSTLSTQTNTPVVFRQSGGSVSPRAGLSLPELFPCTPLTFGAENNTVHVNYIAQLSEPK